MDEKQFLENYNIHDFDVPLCTVDMSIFSLIDGELNILLVYRDEHPCKGLWALPGGFIDLKKDASTEAAAHRKLMQKTGFASGYLEQIETIGSPTRDPRGWSMTVLYYALVDITQVNLEESDKQTQWWPLSKIKSQTLAFDHNDLIDIAIARLQSKATYTALPIELMPKEFTLTELQSVFEMILGRSLQPKAFRNRVLTAGMVEAVSYTHLTLPTTSRV